jgi:hypothetical protein
MYLVLYNMGTRAKRFILVQTVTNKILSQLSDDVYEYEGPSSHTTFPSSMNSVDGTEGFNGFGTQSHPNVESRPSGRDERSIYEEALQVYNV